MIKIIKALRTSVAALRGVIRVADRDTEEFAAARVAIAAAEREIDLELDSFLFGEGSIEITIRTVLDGKMWGNRRVISDIHHFNNYPPTAVVSQAATLLWEEIEREAK
jgi:hypothetical protein